MRLTLKSARVNLNLTQEEAARNLGISRSKLKNWESGRSFPKQPEIEKLCELYRVTYDQIDFCPEHHKKICSKN